MDKKKFAEAINKALEEKGKRKFIQSVEVIINARGVDFSKSENRVNVDILLPKGKGGKELKAAVIAEEALADQAKKGGADLIIPPAALPSYADPKKVKDIAENYFILAQPNLMGQVAKSLGQYLGKRGKLPAPIVGDVRGLIERSKKSIRVATKGKYLPVLQAFVGTESMSADELVENAETVYETVKGKIGGEGNIKSVYIKLTMGKPVKVG
ncbi:50S ribosomal protein L1 [Candidatus Micrarchaeota archaeon]|nr:50S ribosomal protein L1 [Candidatus Micrarchaeota archaeon]